MKWFKMHFEARTDAKLKILSGDQFKTWFNLLCFAAEHRGTIPKMNRFVLSVEVADGNIELLDSTISIAKKLEMIQEDGDEITFHNFSKRQYDKKSDTPSKVAERVKRHRYKNEQYNANVTPCNADIMPNITLITPETPPDTDTDIDTDIDTDTDIDIHDDKSSLSAVVKTKAIEEVVSAYNETCVSLPKVQQITDKRKKTIRVILKNHPFEDFYDVFERVEASDFLSGRNSKWSNCNFDWIVKPENFIKILEGTYDNKASPCAYRLKPTAMGEDLPWG